MHIDQNIYTSDIYICIKRRCIEFCLEFSREL